MCEPDQFCTVIPLFRNASRRRPLNLKKLPEKSLRTEARTELLCALLSCEIFCFFFLWCLESCCTQGSLQVKPEKREASKGNRVTSWALGMRKAHEVLLKAPQSFRRSLHEGIEPRLPRIMSRSFSRYM